jgi:hypothetical protein
MKILKSFASISVAAALIFSQHLGASAATPSCSVTISDSNSVYSGTNSSDVICITGNNDTVNALGGDDTVIDSGNDNTINLGSGDDFFDGSQGFVATVYAGSGNDQLTGTPGDDSLLGDTGNDGITGADGNDSIEGGYGNDFLEGDSGLDNLYGQDGSDTISGGTENDIASGGVGIDTVDAGPGLNMCDYTAGEVQTSTCQYDDFAPTAGLSFGSDSLDLTQATPTLQLHITAQDTTEIQQVTFLCGGFWGGLSYNASSGWYLGVSAGSGSADLSDIRIVGNDSTRADVTATVKFTQNEFAGGAAACSLSTADTVGNHSAWAGPSLNVTSDWIGANDHTAPTGSFAIDSATVDVTSSSATFGYIFNAKDEVGLRQASADCRAPGDMFLVGSNPMQGWGPGNFSFSDRQVVGDGQDVTVTGQIHVPQGTKPATYQCFLELFDLAGNHTSQALGTSLTVVDNDPNLFTAPVVTSASISTQLVDTGAASADVELTYSGTSVNPFNSTGVMCQAGPDAFFSESLRYNAQTYGNIQLEFISSSPSITSTVNSYVWNAHSDSIDVTFHIPFGYKPGIWACKAYAVDLRSNATNHPLGSLVQFRTPAGQPSAPKNLVFTSDGAGSNSGNLSWDSPNELGSPNLYSYLVQVSQDGGTSWSDLAGGGATTTNSINLAGLTPDSNYSFRVRGENGGTLNQDQTLMNLAWSALDIRTPQALAPESPTGFSVSKITGKTASISFSAPATNGGAMITELRCEISRDGNTWTQLNSPGSKSLSNNVSGLSPGVRYQVRISAINSVGQSNYLIGTFTTTDQVAAAPTTLSVKAIKSTILLSWKAVNSSNSTAISNFVVQKSTNNKTWSNVTKAKSTKLSLTISGLKAKTKYWFRVIAVNGAGNSAASKTIAVITQ